MIIKSDGQLHLFEIKKTATPGTELASAYSKVLDAGSVPRGIGAFLCLKEGLATVDKSTLIVRIRMI
ncbi:MAG: hypothetical protein FWG10_10555 [Eubacteriaceae bacterium]|nr:hypothetical protein [Eubacteriaceae bacterium]